MMKKLFLLLIIGVSLAMAPSCASSSSRAIRKAERMMEKQASDAEKEYKRAKEAHYKHQAPKTKKMIREDRRRARQLNRHFRRQ